MNELSNFRWKVNRTKRVILKRAVGGVRLDGVVRESLPEEVTFELGLE